MRVILLLLLLSALIGSTGFLALLLAHGFFSRLRTQTGPKVEVGDGIIYRMQKASTHPGPRAYDVYPAGHGENYSYFVDKFWTVESVLRDGRIVASTRTRKRRYLWPEDPNLRKAGWVARWRYRGRFPELLAAA